MSLAAAPAQPWLLGPQELHDPANVFVFPSEITARFWANRALQQGVRRTVTLDRFLSWDDFKARAFAYPEGLRPANRARRLLFVAAFLEDNRRSPRLRRLVPPGQAGEPLAHLTTLQRLLPALHHAARLPWPESSRAKRQDLELLRSAYERHLREAGLYEPSWETPRLRPETRRHWIFWPELIEDYPEFAALLRGAAWVRTVPAPVVPPTQAPLTLQAHATEGEELKSILAEAAALLDAGVLPEQIAITVGDLPEVEDALLRQARLLQVPLALRHGSPVTEFPAARLFSRLLACHESGMSLSSLKALMLDRVIPWRQEALARALVRVGIEGKVLANRSGQGEADAWLEALRRAAANPALRSLPLARLSGYYRSLRQAIRDAAQCSTFRQLKDRLAVLAGQFLDLSQWSAAETGVYQFCLESLEELQAEAAAAPLPAWRLWLQHLASLRYVPRRPAGGIPVYPYRVAAGIRPKHHLLAGISQAASQHRVRRYPFLAAHEAQGLEDAERDLSAAHLALYSHSGERVGFHYASSRRGQAQLPPAWFLVAGRVEAAALAPDPYADEARAWRAGAEQSLPPPLERQALGYTAARATVLKTRRTGLARRPLRDPSLARGVLDRLSGEGGQLRLSATALESFTTCPLRYLFERALDLGQEVYQPVLEDPRDVGSLLHGAMRRFFAPLAESGGLTPLAEAGRRALREAVEEECRLFEAANPAPLRPVWRALRSRLLDLAETCLEREGETLPGERTVQVEAWMQAPLPAGQEALPAGATPSPAGPAALVGQIDRITAGPAAQDTGYTLLDYKKNRLPTRGEIFGQAPTSFQMPFYVHLMETQGYPVTRALYYSFEQGRFQAVLRPGHPEERLELDGAVAATLDRLRSMSERLHLGDYSLGPAGGTDCAGCPFPALCRMRYVVGA